MRQTDTELREKSNRELDELTASLSTPTERLTDLFVTFTDSQTVGGFFVSVHGIRLSPDGTLRFT